jgi:hypothetical protein
MSNTQLDKAYDDWLNASNSERLSWRESDLTKNAFAAGVDYAAQKHIEMIKKMKDLI